MAITVWHMVQNHLQTIETVVKFNGSTLIFHDFPSVWHIGGTPQLCLLVFKPYKYRYIINSSTIVIEVIGTNLANELGYHLIWSKISPPNRVLHVLQFRGAHGPELRRCRWRCRSRRRGNANGGAVSAWRGENHGRVIGKPWENHRKPTGKLGNHRKTMEKLGKHTGKP